MNDDGTGPLQLTVSQFSERLRRWLERRAELAGIRIVGEISEWKPHANGNVYFALKDERALLRCVSFSSDARGFPAVRDGDAVVATGTIGIWERRSEYQLRVLAIAPFGIGAIAAKVEALRKRLQAEGAFDDSRKRAFPKFPRSVALVSARAKGTEDFETTLHEKAPNVRVWLVETRVQGEGAEIDIADALERASALRPDAIVLLRGGGSYEDRYPFNTEAVVRAIRRSRYPVVTAIGHTGDRHLADEAADAVFKTPTAAAEYIAGSWAEVFARLARQRERLARAFDSIIVRAWQRRDAADRVLDTSLERKITGLQRRILEGQALVERHNPRHRLTQRAQKLATVTESLRVWPLHAARAWKRAVDDRGKSLLILRERLSASRGNQLELARSRLLSSDPEKPLERGYAIVTLRGRTILRAQDAAPGDEIAARLFRGSLKARVEGVTGDE